MIACYLRVSTYDQNNEAQRAALSQWLTSQGHDLAAVHWYEDTATGANLNRPGFEAMQADIFAGKIKTVVVFKLDRLSRDIADGVKLICDWIDRKIRIVAITNQADFSGAMGKTMAGLLMGLAEMEREFIRERQAIGITRAKERGVYKGRKRGSVNRSQGKRPADIAKEVARLRHDEKKTIPQIMARLDIARDTVYRYLRMAEEEGITPSPPTTRPVMDTVKWPKKTQPDNH